MGSCAVAALCVAWCAPPAGAQDACSGASDCADNDPCLDFDCVDGWCAATPNTELCDDADVCTTADVCAGGLCAGVPIEGCGGSCAADAACLPACQPLDPDCTNSILCTAIGQCCPSDAVCDTACPAFDEDCSATELCAELNMCCDGDGRCDAGCPEADSDCCAASGNCCSENGTPSCDDAACCLVVCAVDPFCCSDGWDAVCADAAAELCANCRVPDASAVPTAVDLSCINGARAPLAVGSLIRLKNEVIEVQRRRECQALWQPAQPCHGLIRFEAPATSYDVEALIDGGCAIVGQANDHTLVAALPAGFVPQADLGVDWMGPVRPLHKIARHCWRRTPGASQPLVVEFFTDWSSRRARESLLSCSATIQNNDALPDNVFVVHGTRPVLECLAGIDGVAWITPASAALARGEAQHWCSGVALPLGSVLSFVTFGDGWDGPGGAGAPDIGYHIGNLSSDLPVADQRAAIHDALNEWAKHARLTWTPVDTPGQPRATDILFEHGAHGDGFDFDGNGGQLAHAFPPAPVNEEPIAGDIHLDEDELWELGSGKDLFTVVLHEAGHALGLGHSSDPAAVMYASYNGVVSGLAADDIAGIEALYGAVEPPPRCFAVHNAGSVSLEVGSVDAPAWAGVTPLAPFSVDPGSYVDVCLTTDCTPCDDAPTSGTVSLSTNDPLVPELQIALSLQCTPCASAADCDDAEDCTQDSCDAGHCLNTPIPGCPDDGGDPPPPGGGGGGAPPPPPPPDQDRDGVTDRSDDCPDTPPGVTIDDQGCAASQLDGDNDGVSDAEDLCPDSGVRVAVDARGCSADERDTDADGVVDADDTCPDTPHSEPVNGAGCAESQVVVVEDPIVEPPQNDPLERDPRPRRGTRKPPAAEPPREPIDPAGHSIDPLPDNLCGLNCGAGGLAPLTLMFCGLLRARRRTRRRL